MCSLVKKKSIPDWHLYITQMETKWTKWYAMTSHVIAYRSTELLFGTHTFNFNCFFDDFNCVFTQIRCLSRLLNLHESMGLGRDRTSNPWICSKMCICSRLCYGARSLVPVIVYLQCVKKFTNEGYTYNFQGLQ